MRQTQARRYDTHIAPQQPQYELRYELQDEQLVHGPFALVGVSYRQPLGSVLELRAHLLAGPVFFFARDRLSGTATAGGQTLPATTEQAGQVQTAVDLGVLPELHLGPEQYRRLLELVAKLRARAGLRVGLSESGYLGPQHELAAREQYFFCRAGINIAGVMSNGDLLACPNIDRRFRQGNLRTDSFVEAWERRYQLFRDRSWMRTGPCARCAEWRMWDSGCSICCRSARRGLISPSTRTAYEGRNEDAFVVHFSVGMAF